jgi:transcriptional regulator with XRE-family HTH domain
LQNRLLASELSEAGDMEKSIFSANYDAFLALLREERTRAGLTQEQLAERIGQDQSFVSKCERGERRLDFVEVMAFCEAMGVGFSNFATRFEQAIRSRKVT